MQDQVGDHYACIRLALLNIHGKIGAKGRGAGASLCTQKDDERPRFFAAFGLNRIFAVKETGKNFLQCRQGLGRFNQICVNPCA